MPILRAGPFGDFGTPVDYFVGPDASDQAIQPINCADDFDSSTWPWRYRYLAPDAGVTEYRSGEPGSSTETDVRIFQYSFAYQAAEPFSLDYFASSEGLSDGLSSIAQLNVRLSVDTLGLVDSDSFFGPWVGLNSVSISGSVELPATVVPLRVFLFGSVFNIGFPAAGRSITLSLTGT